MLYNLACLHSLCGERAAALAALGRAVRGDGAFGPMAAADPDFAALRPDPAFEALTTAPLPRS